jgi:hypothetical protein
MLKNQSNKLLWVTKHFSFENIQKEIYLNSQLHKHTNNMVFCYFILQQNLLFPDQEKQ